MGLNDVFDVHCFVNRAWITDLNLLAEKNGFDFALSRTTDGALAAEGRTARAGLCGAAFRPCLRRIGCGLTFDMRGGRQQAKPDVGRPLDGRVRPRRVDWSHWRVGDEP